MSTFELLPAIDLRGGNVVRLRQGDFAQETTYGTDPSATARAFAASGARWLHVVDLDGARAGEPMQLGAIAAVVASVGSRVKVEAAGGLRTEASVAGVLATGVQRVAVGTAALQEPAFAGRLVTAHGALRIVASIDVRDGMALGEGWREGARGLPAEDAVRALSDQGITTFEVTAIDRDGLLGGPDLRLLAGLVALGRGRIIASGGVSSVADIRAARAEGCAGAIVGRAIYEGRLDLADAVAAAAEPD